MIRVHECNEAVTFRHLKLVMWGRLKMRRKDEELLTEKFVDEITVTIGPYIIRKNDVKN